jgi:hypothetical protein
MGLARGAPPDREPPAQRAAPAWPTAPRAPRAPRPRALRAPQLFEYVPPQQLWAATTHVAAVRRTAWLASVESPASPSCSPTTSRHPYPSLCIRYDATLPKVVLVSLPMGRFQGFPNSLGSASPPAPFFLSPLFTHGYTSFETVRSFLLGARCSTSRVSLFRNRARQTPRVFHSRRSPRTESRSVGVVWGWLTCGSGCYASE